ncbi:RING finger protein nhl-1 isoform X7 [Drosophila elegans]|uniref:RING finger protein nhl-1 isoform X7 n=1 Tax=Drosophila elegans TaxID=30023 RepID=UPI001BC82ED3|nr:RING finger protein nhl-1 isoform X7 [Drosophila elegans]
MEQFEQLLTCCVCLDRYRIPKLLPCQHSFCMEPCMEGLVDYVRRQVKCPECRAEHRIPYNGVQAFPTNVTLQRFLELHIEITGELPDPTSGQIMERCGVCSEKAYLSHCAHCEKKICEDCKSAHMDILRREITRFNSQIRRSLHRLQDSLAIIEKNTMSLQTNAISVTEEIDEIYQRITKAIKDRSDQLKGEIDRYLAVELRNLTTLKANLDLEITNITSNCDTVDKYMNETVEWDDCELMDTKEIFLKTVEFLRHFEYENNDYSRRVRFLVSIDPNQLVMNLATFGDLNIAPHSTPSGGSVSSSHLAPPSALQPGLMRSKSDHRLATQFRQQEERSGYNDEPVLGGRKFGERPQRSATQANNDRYGRSGDYDYENDYENEGSSGRAGKSSRFRSRFVRSHQNDDSDSEQQQQLRQQELKERKDRVLDSEDVSRGQLSGIIRLSDCSRVVQRLADIGKEKKEKKSDAAAAAQAAVQAAIQAQKAAMQRQQQKNQQTAADEEELARQKRKNAASSSAAGGAATSTSTSGGGGDAASDQRVTALKNRGGEESDGSSNQAASPVRNSAASATRAETASATDSDATPTPTIQQSKPPVSAQVAAVKKTQRSGSSDSSASTESSASSAAAAAAVAATSAAPAAPASTASSGSSNSAASQPAKAPSSARYSTARDSTAVPEKKPFVSRFLPQHSTANASNGSADKKKAESSSSSEEETSSESESESEPETKAKTSATSSSTTSKSTPSSAASSTTAASGSTTSGSYRDRLEARRASRDDSSSTAAGRSSYATPSSSGYGSGSGTSSGRTRTVPAPHHASESEDRYGSGTGSSALPFSIPYISRPSRARYRKRLTDV